MPGPVIQGHVDLEDNCESCHSSFDASKQDVLCLDCHEKVASDLASNRGFHGRLDPPGSCKRCHTEHQGRAADIVGLNVDLFDHGLTDFALDGAHTTAACESCHAPDQSHRSASHTCAACHDEVHEGNLGTQCADCHGTTTWQIAAFDHATTDFPLQGEHRDAGCQSCHLQPTFAAPSDCVSCHRAEDVHSGRRGEACGDCHSDAGWSGAQFDHQEITGFELQGQHADLGCAACHLEELEIPEPPTTCYGCHSANDPHQGRNGTDCSQCHSQRSWQDAQFDHAAETGFALVGGHGSLTCSSCHTGQLTDPLETTCASCHAEDDPHAGVYTSCQRCHNPTGWWEVAFDHDFTQFPLIGHHKLVSCESCHTEDTFQGTSQTCIDCHPSSDHHDGNFSPHCQRCHNPNGWSRWQFDHDRETAFVLDGGHTDLVCDACHKSNVWDTNSLSSCAQCHGADDVHEGRFGNDCAECHTTGTFSDVRAFRR